MTEEETRAARREIGEAILVGDDRQRIELALELLEKVPGKAVSGARSLLRSGLKKA